MISRHTVFSLILCLFSTYAVAGEMPPPPPTSPPPLDTIYDCEVIVIAKDLLQGSATFKYQTTADRGTHGGPAYSFSAGIHKVSVLSDGRWLAISWMRGETTVGQATFARNEFNQGSETLIVGNPLDANEQVSVDCTKH
jgi:hypothetical protein